MIRPEPPEIRQLDMDAALAEERATAAKARVQIARLEHQRSLLGEYSPTTASTHMARASWLFLAAIVAFVAWSVTTDPHPRVARYAGLRPQPRVEAEP
jgi:hypothetical protein